MTEDFARRYRLEPYIKLQPGERDGFIYSSFPLFVSRTSRPVLELLHYCDGTHSVADLARQLKLKPHSVLKVLEELRGRGFVQILPPPSPGEWPGVSVVIPVYNRPADLRRCLEALLRLDYPADKLEIIVVDDASTDTTPEVAASYPVVLLRNSSQLGPAGSRNRAIAAARQPLIACVDSDCLVSPDWLRRLVPLFADEKLAATGGQTRAASTASLIERYEDCRSSLNLGRRRADVQLGRLLSYLPTCNLVFRKAAFEQISGFAPALRFGEDVDFCWRLLKNGWRIYYEPDARLGHAYRNDLFSFLKTRFDYATSEAALLARHPEQRRTLLIPFWLFSLLGRNNFSFFLCILSAFIQKWWSLRQYPTPLGPWQVLVAQIRSFGAMGYHFGVHLGKYYSFPLLLGLLPRRSRFLSVFVLVAPPIIDYLRLRPRLNLAAFIGLILLENFSYQLGLLAGCLRQKKYLALLPRLRLHS